MRALGPWLLLLGVGCSTDLGGRPHGDAGASEDAATTPDGGPGTDAAAPGPDVGLPIDAASVSDASVTPDLGPSCVPAYDCTACCGDAPDGCGSTLGCDPCADDVWCAPSSPARYGAEVQASVQSVMDTRPELFDPVMFRDTSSWLVIDDAGYTAAVVGACNARGLVCISDPNDDHEMRVHGPSDHQAENYGIRVHSSNRTWYRFMGGICETTQF